MIDPVGITGLDKSRIDTKAQREEKLRKAASQLEGVFVQQMYKAMRDTVPQGDGIVSGGAGEDMFTSMMDQHLAAETPKHWGGGIAEAVYKQMRRGLDSGTTPVAPDTATTLHKIVR